MTDSRQRVEVPITKPLEGLVQKGFPQQLELACFQRRNFRFAMVSQYTFLNGQDRNRSNEVWAVMVLHISE